MSTTNPPAVADAMTLVRQLSDTVRQIRRDVEAIRQEVQR